MDTNKQSMRGFTLVEVMVAMLIIFIVLGGVYQTIVRENVNMDKQEIILDMQNNARSAMDRITREVRRTGFLGCGGDLAANTVANADPTPANPIKPNLISTETSGGSNWDTSTSLLGILLGLTNVDYLGEPIGFADNATAVANPRFRLGTDAISLIYLTEEKAMDPLTAMAASNADVKLESTGSFGEGDLLLITDCEDYSLFQKTTCNDAQTLKHATTDGCGANDVIPLNSGTDLGKAYGSTAQARVFKYNIATFFIGTGGTTLYQDRNNAGIAEGMEDLQVEFKYDTDNDGDLSDEVWLQTIPVNSAAFSSKDVRAIRVWILAQSDNVFSYTNTKTYDYPNSPYYSAANPFASANGAGGAPNDNRYRYLISSEVYLRNAGLK